MGVRVLAGVKGRGRGAIQLYRGGGGGVNTVVQGGRGAIQLYKSKHLGLRTKSTNTKQLKPSLAQNTV